MNRFEYVMVLISIIVGLAMTHILQGVGGIIDRRSRKGRRLELSLVHGAWLAFTFVWLVQFWWWEFRFSELHPEWTVELYLFLVTYAVALFLLAVILVPQSWDGVESLDDYFLARRGWFYSGLLAVIALDVIDSYLKGGWRYVVHVNGPWTWTFWSLMAVAAIAGIRSPRLRLHKLASVILLVWQQVYFVAEFSALGL